MIRVVIADDHDVIREGVKRILEDAADIQVVAEARDGREMIDALRRQAADVVVMDLSMPGRGGLDALKTLKDEWPKLPVLVLSMHETAQYALRVLRAGAAGYVNKGSAGEQLLPAIRKAASGGRYITPELAELLAEDLTGAAGQLPHERLSDREFQVMRLLAAGRTVSEIARELALSVQTISTHRTHILEKLGLENTAQVIRYAHQHRLVD